MSALRHTKTHQTNQLNLSTTTISPIQLRAAIAEADLLFTFALIT